MQWLKLFISETWLEFELESTFFLKILLVMLLKFVCKCTWISLEACFAYCFITLPHIFILVTIVLLKLAKTCRHVEETEETATIELPIPIVLSIWLVVHQLCGRCVLGQSVCNFHNSYFTGVQNCASLSSWSSIPNTKNAKASREVFILRLQ